MILQSGKMKPRVWNYFSRLCKRKVSHVLTVMTLRYLSNMETAYESSACQYFVHTCQIGKFRQSGRWVWKWWRRRMYVVSWLSWLTLQYKQRESQRIKPLRQPRLPSTNTSFIYSLGPPLPPPHTLRPQWRPWSPRRKSRILMDPFQPFGMWTIFVWLNRKPSVDPVTIGAVKVNPSDPDFVAVSEFFQHINKSLESNAFEQEFLVFLRIYFVVTF